MNLETLDKAKSLLELECQNCGDKDVFKYAKRAFYELEMVSRLINILKTDEMVFSDVSSETRKGVEAAVNMLEQLFVMQSVRNQHHIWCNNFCLPVENCKMCQGLWERYPYDTPEEISDLHKKYFPGVVKV